MDEKEIANLLRQERLRRALPWTPISAEYLAATELLSLIGIGGKGRRYRRTIRYLRVASSRSDSTDRMPDYLKDCFREHVRVHVFKGRGHGAVEVEYRIPIESLRDKYAARAKRLISVRRGKATNSICVSHEAYRELTALSMKKQKSISEIVEAWVHREFGFSLECSGIVALSAKTDV